MERDAAVARLTYDEAVGLQWALVGRRFGELKGSGSRRPGEGRRSRRRHASSVAVRVDRRAKRSPRRAVRRAGGERPMNRMLQGEVGSGKTIVSVLAMLQMVNAGYQCACWRRRKSLSPNTLVRSVTSWVRWRWRDNSAVSTVRHGIALLTGSMSPQQKRAVRDEVAKWRSGHRDRHACAAAGSRRVPPPRHGRRRRTTPVRGRAARSPAGRGARGCDPAPAGDDRDADSAHRRAHSLRRP